mmetsp:Transcript_18179/g.64689  ORF Transcript_18179/g.64689 Transcript_18179/m.64689 type:complete len:232 (+) Transcript_18179:32-727(+)
MRLLRAAAAPRCPGAAFLLWELARGGEDEAEEGRRRVLRPRLELRVVLRAQVKRVIRPRELSDLHARARIVLAREAQARRLDGVNDFWVDLIAVAVAFRNLVLAAVQSARDRCLLRQRRRPRAEAHVATHGGFVDFRHKDDRRVRRDLVEFRRVGAGASQHSAAVLDDHDLHAEADAEVGLFLLAAKLGSQNHALHAALPKATGHDDAVDARQHGPRLGVLLRGRFGGLRL